MLEIGLNKQVAVNKKQCCSLLQVSLSISDGLKLFDHDDRIYYHTIVILVLSAFYLLSFISNEDKYIQRENAFCNSKSITLLHYLGFSIELKYVSKTCG